MIRIGIIGSGFGLYGLLPAFNAIPRCQVVCICGSKTEKLINFCKSIGLKKIYTDWQGMLEREQLNAIALAVPPNIQYQIAKFAIKIGLNIFAEKPLAASYKQAKELLKLARKKKITHSIDFIFPEIEQWKKVKELINKRTFGKLKQICVNWDFMSYDIKNRLASWKTNVSEGGGALSFYFSHSLYYLEYFIGEILNLKGFLSYSEDSLNGGEIGVDIFINFKNGIYGYAHLRCNSKDLNRHQLIFICEKATIVLENKNNVTDNFFIKIFSQNEQVHKIKQLSKQGARIKTDEDERVRVVKEIASRFIDACIHKTQVTPSFKEGVRVQELIEKIRVNSYV